MRPLAYSTNPLASFPWKNFQRYGESDNPVSGHDPMSPGICLRPLTIKTGLCGHCDSASAMAEASSDSDASSIFVTTSGIRSNSSSERLATA